MLNRRDLTPALVLLARFITGITFLNPVTALAAPMKKKQKNRLRSKQITVGGKQRQLFIDYGDEIPAAFFETVSTSSFTAAAKSCKGTSTGPYRVQLLIGGPKGHAPTSADIAEAREAAEGASVALYQATGGRRTIKYHRDKHCNISVKKVTVRQPERFWGMVNQLYELGADDLYTKYILFSTVPLEGVCGLSTAGHDPRKRINNWNNEISHAIVSRDCYTPFVTLHELFHGLGAVHHTAPNATPHGHCTDEFDLMCYDDGSQMQMRVVCSPSTEGIGEEVDCGKQDYFSLAPQPGSYLADHWNTADSNFLMDPTRNPRISLRGKKRLPTGKRVRVRINGFVPNEPVFLRLNNRILKPIRANRSGTWGGTLRIPSGVKPGVYRITAQGGRGTYTSSTVLKVTAQTTKKKKPLRKKSRTGGGQVKRHNKTRR